MTNAHAPKTILLVDDQPLLLQLVGTMLHRLGYAVLAVDSPVQALGIARQLKQPIDLLLSDIVMPFLNGLELAQLILLERPQLRVLLMSGDAHEVLVDHQIANEAVPFIHKPFTARELAVKIKEVLGE